MSSSVRMRIADKLNHGTAMFFFLMITVSLLLTWFAIDYHNKNATNGYKLKKLQEKRSELTFQIETLEMEIADLGALKKEE